jgi:hypothetical protein
MVRRNVTVESHHECNRALVTGVWYSPSRTTANEQAEPPGHMRFLPRAVRAIEWSIDSDLREVENGCDMAVHGLLAIRSR